MKTLGERIRDLRKQAGYTQSEFIDILKKEYNLKADRVMLSKWECSKQCPHIETLKCIANALGVSLDYLNGIEEKPKAIIKNITQLHETQMPMYGNIACGSPIECNTDFDIETLSGNIVNGDFCVVAKGDSMINARIFEGDIVTIRRQSVVENGEIAAVVIGDEATLKRVYYIENGIMLVPENPAYKPMVFTGEECQNVIVLGKAVSMQTRLN
ncbi:MAG: helix-turn-helix domain-containing protein [Clostridia bacterium]|nr:helix-turn-helix domain-containing protein [Clostridia bacterium]